MKNVGGFTSFADIVKRLGEEEVYRLAVRQYDNEQYRKERNIKQQAIMEAVKSDPRFKKLAEEAKARIMGAKK